MEDWRTVNGHVKAGVEWLGVEIRDARVGPETTGVFGGLRIA